MKESNSNISTGYTSGNNVKLVHSGKAFFDILLKIINEAKTNLFLQFYIFLNDETGAAVIESLKAAATRKVSVYLHIDSYASKELSSTCIKEMRDKGINVKLFEPLLRSKHFYFGRRLHHKVVVADGIYSLVGGINICNRYNDMPDQPAWLDMALYCEGEASINVETICSNIWRGREVRVFGTNKKVEAKISTSEKISVRACRNDWVKGKKEIWNSYLEMFSKAERTITIMCSYFLPGHLFRRKIKAAVKRGVKVQLILAGSSDVMLAKHAERYLYDWMLRNNITIYEYTETVLHAKMAVYDSSWVTIGSYNVNGLSAHASLEMNMAVSNLAFAVTAEKELQEIIQMHCKQVTKENYSSSTTILRKFWQWVCYNIINKMLFAVTFYFKQEK